LLNHRATARLFGAIADRASCDRSVPTGRFDIAKLGVRTHMRGLDLRQHAIGFASSGRWRRSAGPSRGRVSTDTCERRDT